MDCMIFEARTILYIVQIHNNAGHGTPYIYTMLNAVIRATLNNKPAVSSSTCKCKIDKSIMKRTCFSLSSYTIVSSLST